MLLPYFPFPPAFDLKMGTAPLSADNPLVEIDRHYINEISLKRKLLTEDPAYYYRSSSSTIPAQWEVVKKILTGLSARYAQHFTFFQDGSRIEWENRLLGESVSFTYGDSNSLPFEPLDWVGRQIQEDLILLDNKSILVAGQLCFPSGWSLDEKFEKHFLELHAPLPALMKPMLQAADKLIERIPEGKPIARTNWGFRVSNQLDLSSRHADRYREALHQTASLLTKENTGDKIFLRIERQTLSRLSESGSVLFTIHTYNNTVKNEAKDKGRAEAMLSFLKTVPDELLAYKQMTPITRQLIAYLDSVL